MQIRARRTGQVMEAEIKGSIVLIHDGHEITPPELVANYALVRVTDEEIEHLARNGYGKVGVFHE